MKLSTFSKTITAAFLAISACSCRSLIFEDRSVCPAFLFFDITNGELFDPAEPFYVAAFEYPSENRMNADTTTVKETQDKTFYLEVKRTESLYGYGVIGFEGTRLDAMTRWVVDEGQMYSPLYRCEYRSNAFGESFTIPVEMTKEHTKVKVKFKDFDRFPGTGGIFPFRAVVHSNTCGLDAQTGEPIKGAFKYEPKESPGGTFQFIVPRQYDRSLTFDIYGKEGLHETTDLVASFDLWSLFRENEDFSWDAKNLLDMEVEIHYVASEFTISVRPWSGEDVGWEYEF